MSKYTNEIEKRRTFAIISHPDAGKTTLTEKFLLYGGAINLAGSVKGKATARHAVSDWMEIEKERGISVTSSVLQFHYDGYCINILDTPGHQDFSEDTYRTLMAADSAVMVIDGSKGVEAQTRKLFKVCVMRHIPIFTFINKMDRDANDTFDLLDEIEKELGIATCPINWPIGSGKKFRGVYDRDTEKILTFSDTQKGTKEGVIEEIPLSDSRADEIMDPEQKAQLLDEIELLDGASADYLTKPFDTKELLARVAVRLREASRSPLAAVYTCGSLTLDNSSHALDVEADEVTIGRRYYRSGESEYSINGQICRLKDVYELLLDTGIGRDGYSVIGQGRIAEIVAAKSSERREIFEEACGSCQSDLSHGERKIQ